MSPPYNGDSVTPLRDVYRCLPLLQAVIMATIIIAMWATCVSRAYRFRRAVESYEGKGSVLTMEVTNALCVRRHIQCDAHPT